MELEVITTATQARAWNELHPDTFSYSLTKAEWQINLFLTCRLFTVARLPLVHSEMRSCKEDLILSSHELC